jgi:hypothetical protein
VRKSSAFFGTIAATALASCVAPAPTRTTAARAAAPVAVSNNGLPFQMWEGAAARKVADAQCGGRVNTSIYDRFDRTTGQWVYPEGCA